MSKVQTQHNYQEIYSKAIKGMPQDQHSRYPPSCDLFVNFLWIAGVFHSITTMFDQGDTK